MGYLSQPACPRPHLLQVGAARETQLLRQTAALHLPCTCRSPQPASRGDAYVPREPLWMDLFAEGSQDRWMDFRADKAAGKRSPKFPDFKRKGDDAPLVRARAGAARGTSEATRRHVTRPWQQRC